MTSIQEAQQDMQSAYYGGATGAACSATAWLAAALAAAFGSPKTGIMTLVFGGMLIFPASVVLSKAVGRSGKHDKNNPLASLALENTFWMLLSIPIAIGAALHKPEWFFPAMLLVIGGRYLTFKTLYGMKIYWAFGITLATLAFPLMIMEAPTAVGAFAGALIEYAYAVVIALLIKKRGTTHPSP